MIQEAGTKNEKIMNVKVNVAGEVVTIDVADMNKDSYSDIVVTTRTSAIFPPFTATSTSMGAS